MIIFSELEDYDGSYETDLKSWSADHLGNSQHRLQFYVPNKRRILDLYYCCFVTLIIVDVIVVTCGTSLFALTLIHDYPYVACILHLVAMLVSVLRHRVKKFCYIWCMICLLIIKSYMSEILFICLKMSEILSEIVRNRQ